MQKIASSFLSKVNNILSLRREFVLIIVIIFSIFVVSTLSDRFFTLRNFQVMSPYLVEVGLISIGMTMVILIKGIDLSVGSIAGLCAILLGLAWRDGHLNIWIASGLALIAGTFAGFFNGLVITKVRMPDLVVTLATMAIYRGIAEGLTGGQPITKFPLSFQKLGQSLFLGVPIQVWILLIAVLISGFMLEKSAFGRYLFAMGNNETAARFAGVKVENIRIYVYTLSGFLSALAAIIYVARVNTARSDIGTGWLFEVITGVVLGGTSIAGGEGSIWGSILGLALILIIRNGLTLAGISTQAQAVVIGCILIITVLINESLRNKRS
ncbi:MAG: ABC transporter permease [Anaerolineae bacterium]|nr:ABC transporter permease [Anaerolineae bacterium]